MSKETRRADRRAREAEQRKAEARRRRNVALVSTVVGLLVVIVVVFAVTRGGNEPGPSPSATSGGRGLPGEQDGAPPWDAGGTDLAARLHAIGIPALPSEAFELHIHQHLDVYVDGNPVTVPAGVGIDPDQQFISPLHTHDTTGIVHVESPTKKDFTLGEFFDVWGVRLDARCIGGECAAAGGPIALSVFSNGTPVQGDPRALVLTEHEEIVVSFGTQSDVPHPVPSTFDFPKGL